MPRPSHKLQEPLDKDHTEQTDDTLPASVSTDENDAENTIDVSENNEDQVEQLS